MHAKIKPNKISSLKKTRNTECLKIVSFTLYVLFFPTLNFQLIFSVLIGVDGIKKMQHTHVLDGIGIIATTVLSVLLGNMFL